MPIDRDRSPRSARRSAAACSAAADRLGLVAFGVFLSGFVIAEPAPYEVFMVACLIGVWFVLGLKISRTVAPLLALFLILFMTGGILSLTQMRDLGGGTDGPIYIAVSTFLA